jgi:hypothetical protein
MFLRGVIFLFSASRITTPDALPQGDARRGPAQAQIVVAVSPDAKGVEAGEGRRAP